MVLGAKNQDFVSLRFQGIAVIISIRVKEAIKKCYGNFSDRTREKQYYKLIAASPNENESRGENSVILRSIAISNMPCESLY